MNWQKKDLKRSYECNPKLLVKLREQKGITQAVLAELVGYSERLISKAETGGAISTSTIADLADVFSTPHEPVFPEDLINDPVTLARKFMEAIHQVWFVDNIRQFFDDEIVFKMAGDIEQIPFAGTHVGIEAVEKAWRIFFSVLEIPEGRDNNEGYTYHSQSSNEVFVSGETWIQPIGMPIDRPIKVMLRLKFRRGKILEYDDVFDTQKAVHDLEKNAQRRPDIQQK